MKQLSRHVSLAGTALIAFALLTACGTTGADAVGAVDAASTPASSNTSLVPTNGAYLGFYYGDRSISATNTALGTTPAIHLTYFDWKSDWSHDPILAADTKRGQISLVNWEPFDADFHKIVSGSYDALITKQAQGAGALPKKVLLDFAAEMNEEEGWGGRDTKLYIAAWRHIHDIFDRYAKGHVEWVWAPNNTDSDGGAPTALEYYPGSAYVDWTGIDGYNWGTSDPDFDWQSFSSVFGDMYDNLHTLGKPIIIGETASAETGGSKSAWISGIMPTLKSRFPDIKAVVWFDVKKERDWRIRSSRNAQTAFVKFAKDPYIVQAH